MNVHSIVAARNSPHLAVAEMHRTVVVWNGGARSSSAELDTVFLGGGDRLVLSADGACASRRITPRGGVACYRSCDGKEVWHRRDIRRTQRLSLARDGSAIYSECDNRPTLRLDLESGSTLLSLKGVQKIVESPFMPVTFLEQRGARLQTDQGRLIALIPPYEDEAIFLLAMFTPKHLCTSEMGGPLQTFDLEAGTETWRYSPKAGSHVLHLAYSQANECLFGVEYWFVDASSMKLWRFDSEGRGLNVRASRKPSAASACRIALS